MHIDVAHSRQNGKVYRRVLLRDSYREGRKVKHRTIANLSKCSEEEIAAMRLALKHKNELADLHERLEKQPPKDSVSEHPYTVEQGLSAGAVGVVYQLARQLGITEALGQSRHGRLALWQVIARVIDQGSRLSAVRLANSHAACDLLGLESFNEDDLYENLKWICTRQNQIEGELFRGLYRGEPPQLFLYDVTSSYLEGEHNQLAAFGYNRDGKRGKRQIVIGLLCDVQGIPLSVEVFSGNTSDPATFASQVRKVAGRFGANEVTFVGDRGMIKGPQIEDLGHHGFHYITAITKPQVEALLKADTLQMELFDQPLAEVEEESLRYILRRNPERAAQVAATRQSKLGKIQTKCREATTYLQEHPKAKPATQVRKIAEKIKQLKLDGWLKVDAEGREVKPHIDQEQRHGEAKLDGCYVLKTDLNQQQAGKQTVHDRYKDLAKVEKGFRTCKTEHLEARPIFVRLEESTRAHVLVVMLAYRIRQELARRWGSLNLTVEEGLQELASLCFNKANIAGKGQCNILPKPRATVAELIDLAQVKIPEVIPCRNIKVATRKKLQKERKNQ